MTRLLAALLLCLALTALRAGGDTPAPPAPAPTLQATNTERAFFQLGDQLGQAAFAYAPLARQAAQVAHTHSKLTQIERLAALSPLADRSRAGARDGFNQALTLMHSLSAPSEALQLVLAADERLKKPAALTGDARTVSLFSRRAAQTLGTLDEFNQLSSLPEDPALQHWVASAAAEPSAQVWYAEGLIAALAEIADSQQMPELLPPPAEIANDLRGLRDWLALRLTDPPTPDQEALETALDAFLAGTSRTGAPQTAPLTALQLQSLGDISRRLRSQMLGDAASDLPIATDNDAG